MVRKITIIIVCAMHVSLGAVQTETKIVVTQDVHQLRLATYVAAVAVVVPMVVARFWPELFS